MTIQEAIVELAPLSKRLNCSIHITPASVWIWSHQSQMAEPQDWKIYLGKPIDESYSGHTLAQVVDVVESTYREGAASIADVQIAADEIDAMALQTA